MKLSIIMPVYNEAATVREMVTRVQSVPIEKEIVIVDDGSTDNTRDLLLPLAAEKNVRLIFHEVNQGKAAAIRTALPHCMGEIISIQDGDLETNPNDFVHLTQPIREGKCAVVYGSRYLKPNERKLYFTYWLGVRVLSIAVRGLYGQRITDEATCYKVFRADVLRQIPIIYNRFEFCPEVTARVSKLGYKITELPMDYYPRSFSEGKKMSWRDGVKALWVLVKLRFVD